MDGGISAVLSLEVSGILSVCAWRGACGGPVSPDRGAVVAASCSQGLAVGQAARRVTRRELSARGKPVEPDEGPM